jgi:hypothetical protein
MTLDARRYIIRTDLIIDFYSYKFLVARREQVKKFFDIDKN